MLGEAIAPVNCASTPVPDRAFTSNAMFSPMVHFVLLQYLRPLRSRAV
jgi:hypothetical protein